MPLRELERLQAVDRFLKLEISSENEMQEIIACAANICNVPIAMVTLIGEDTQYIKFKIGTDLEQTSRADAFCEYTISEDSVMVVPDTAHDSRFVDHPYRKGQANIQFYAGAPLTTVDGIKLGTLCVVDHEPKTLSDVQQQMLSILAKQVVHILEFEHSLQVMKDQYLEAKANELKLRSLFDSSAACHLLVGTDMKILYFNKAISDFMRQNHGQDIGVGLSVLDFVGQDFVDSFLTSFNRALLGEHITIAHSLYHSGREIWWQFNYYPAYDSEGKIIGVSYAASDQSELKRSQEDATRKRNALDRIAIIQSHDIRRPLSSILGLVALLKLAELPQVAQEVNMLDRAVSELDDTIRNIVTSSTS